jgi:zinc D-Ala-D-Ala carboxypeptidase
MPTASQDDIKLSAHFTMRELTRSDVAVRLGLENIPDADSATALEALCRHVLEPLRVHIKQPVSINSGFRSPSVNGAVGGASTSQHCRGEAADIEVTGVSNVDLARMIIDLKLPFDQLILEFYKPGDPNSGWVHVSHKAGGNNRKEVLTVSKVSGKTVYTKGLP